MSMQKTRWSKVYESSEEELSAFLRSRNIQATRIVAEALTEQMQQVADIDSTIWCAEGSLVVRTDSGGISLQPGDTLYIDANITYDMHAGISGYVCYVSN